jgi:GDP-mannose 6-dehydrogenase
MGREGIGVSAAPAAISVFGLGYVGAVSAACLAEAGHRVVGVDVVPEKAAAVAAGLSPVVEPGLEALLASGVAAGRLTATTDAVRACRETGISLICVGTPSRKGGGLDLSHVVRVGREIGLALRGLRRRHLVVLRSTVLPGTADQVLIPALAEGALVAPRSAEAWREAFGVVVNPEFLREGTSLKDYATPPYTLLGGDDPDDLERVAALYRGVQAEVVTVDRPTAEMAKYANNAFHALKVGFANEIGTLARALGVDGRAVMDLVRRDTKLNISGAYLTPGFAFGGSCLPKDVRALAYAGTRADLSLPLVASILPSNEAHQARALELVLAEPRRPLAVLGLAFKPGTDDLRESPQLALVEQLIGKGFRVRIFDRAVSLARLVGANKTFLERAIPHVAELLVPSPEAALDGVDLVVVASHDPEVVGALERLPPGAVVIDLVGAVAAAPPGVTVRRLV